MSEDTKPVRILIEKEVRIPVLDDNDVILEVGDIIEILPKIKEKEEVKDLEDKETEEKKKEKEKEKEDKKEDRKTALRKEFHERMKKKIAERREQKKKE